jgi:hypothetical protein
MLREKQIEQLAFYIANPKCLDLSDPGTGKTPPCCVYAYYMHAREGKRTLWSMPKSLLKKNRKEMLRFTEFKPGEVEIMRTDRANMTRDWTGATIESTRRLRGFECVDGTNTVEIRDQRGNIRIVDDKGEVLHKGVKGSETFTVTPKRGPDGAPMKCVVDAPEKFKDLIQDAADRGVRVLLCTFAFMSEHWERVLKAMPDIDLLLVDELHMGYGGPESKQTESFYYVNQHVSRFVGMTGTLINGRLDNAFPALHVIEPRYYGSYKGFIFEHCAVMDDYGRVTVWKHEPKLRDIIERHSIRRTFEEVYGKEDVVFFTEEIEMGEEMRDHYDEFHEQAMLELDDGRILDGSMPGVALIRARQIMAHPETMFDDGPKWTEKDERLRVHLSGGKKTLIFAALQPEQERIKRLCEDLGLRVALINANVSGPARERIDEAAQRHELDVIVASGPTAAVGFNWEMFDLVIFASIDYMDVNILQAYRRASRGTRTKTLHVVFLRYENSCESKIFLIVRKKSQLANRVDPTRPVLTFGESYVGSD